MTNNPTDSSRVSSIVSKPSFHYHHKYNHSHNHATSLQLLDNLGQELLGQLLDFLVVVVVVLLLAALLLASLLWCSRIASVLWLLPAVAAVLRLASMLLVSAVLSLVRWYRGSALQVHIHDSGIGFRRVLQTQLLADFLDSRLDLLDMVHGVISLADDAADISVGLCEKC